MPDDWPPEVAFHPREGRDYGHHNLFGLPRRLLILGLSHYIYEMDEEKRPTSDDSHQITHKVVDEHINLRRNCFFTKVQRMVCGIDFSTEHREGFWNAVAFYNFVQRPLPKPKIAPSKEDIQASLPALRTVLDRLQPSHVIGLGAVVQKNLFSFGDDEKWIEAGGKRFPYRSCTIGGRTTLILGVAHPARWGFTYEPWHLLIRAFLALPHPDGAV